MQDVLISVSLSPKADWKLVYAFSSAPRITIIMLNDP